MKRIFLCIVLVICTFGCKKKESSNVQTPPVLYVTPKSAPVNLTNGYTHNVVSGDSISPITELSRKGIVSGHLFPVKPRVLTLKPTVLPVANAKIQKWRQNIHIVKVTDPTIHHVQGQKQSLSERQAPIINPKGDTIPTLQPLPLVGKKQLMKFAPATVIKPAYSQDNTLLNVQDFSTKQGFSSSKVYDIHPSVRGGMWLATYDGITYYDGTSFTDFTINEGLPGSNVRSIIEDTKGCVWFCPRQNGLCRYDGDTLTTFTSTGGLMNDIIFRVVEDKSGNIWWSSQYGVTKYDGKQATHYRLGKANYTKLFIDAKGSVWTASNKEIAKIEGENVTSFDLTKIVVGSRVATIFEDKKGNMWFGLHKGGILKYDGNQFEQYTRAQGLPGTSVYTIIQDHKGDLWFGTNKGLVKYKEDEFSIYTTNEGLTSNFIIKLIEDSHKKIWLGTFDKGLMKFDPISFSHQNLLQGGSDKEGIVRAFHKDIKGDLWATTRNVRLLKIGKDTTQAIALHKPNANHIAYSLIIDKRNDFWIGVKGGVIRYTSKQCLFYPIIPQNEYTTALASDDEGNVWVETTHGILKFDGEQFSEYPLPLTSLMITTILVDSKGNIWVGTEKGICKIKDDQMIWYTEKEGLSSLIITDLLEDTEGDLWIGTSLKGLMLFDGQIFTYYTVEQSLSSNFIKSMVEDKQKNIWLGTEKGLCLMQAQPSLYQEKRKTYKVINYGYTDGLKSLSFEMRAVTLDKDNKVWWSAGRSVINLDLNSFQVSKGIPKVRLRQLDINGRFVNFRLLSDSLKSKIVFENMSSFENYPKSLTLDYTHNNIKLHFSAINTDKSHRIKYSYRIKNLSKLWTPPHERPFAEYQHLPFGTHTFQVKAIGDDQIWSKTTEYTFRIKPPWWKSKGFVLLYMLIGIALVAICIKWYLARSVQRQKLLEKKVKSRTAELNKAVQRLNQLNVDLQSSKNEVMTLKEKEQEILSNQIKQREDELLLVMKMINEKREKTAEMIDELFTAIKNKSHKEISSIAKKLAKFVESTSDLDILMERIEEEYSGTLMKIKVAYPDLTANDLKHCLYIKLNLTLKETAELHNVSVYAVKMARNRLKKKMVVSQDISLKDFIESAF